MILYFCTPTKNNENYVFAKWENMMSNVNYEQFCNYEEHFVFYNYFTVQSVIPVSISEYDMLTESQQQKLLKKLTQIYYIKRSQCKSANK